MTKATSSSTFLTDVYKRHTVQMVNI